MTQKVLETKVEPQGRAAEAKPGWRRTEAEQVLPRTGMKPEGKEEPDGAKQVYGQVTDEGS